MIICYIHIYGIYTVYIHIYGIYTIYIYVYAYIYIYIEIDIQHNGAYAPTNISGFDCWGSSREVTSQVEKNFHGEMANGNCDVNQDSDVYRFTYPELKGLT